MLTVFKHMASKGCSGHGNPAKMALRLYVRAYLYMKRLTLIFGVFSKGSVRISTMAILL